MKVFVSFTPNIISAIISLIIGVILFTRPDLVTIVISYMLGTLLLIYGIWKIIYFSYQKGKDNTISNKLCIPGILLIVIGLIFIFLSSAVEQFVRFLIGALILIVGINRIINLSSIDDKKSSRFIASLIVSLIIIGIGLYIILYSNLVFSSLGLIIIIYSIMEIVNYIIVSSDRLKTGGIPEGKAEEKKETIEIETKEQLKKNKKRKKIN